MLVQRKERLFNSRMAQRIKPDASVEIVHDAIFTLCDMHTPESKFLT